jgi:NADH-quinone oxidoreductase subunit E
MLTEHEKKEIREVIANSRGKRAAALDALKVVQEHRGWISDELTAVAQMLDMTPVELDSIATFYDQIFRKPVGKHVITICDSASCWVTGAADLIDHLLTSLGVGLAETTEDGQFTVLPAACLGACEQAPAMMVDDQLYGNLTASRIDKILELYR